MNQRSITCSEIIRPPQRAGSQTLRAKGRLRPGHLPFCAEPVTDKWAQNCTQAIRLCTPIRGP